MVSAAERVETGLDGAEQIFYDVRLRIASYATKNQYGLTEADRPQTLEWDRVLASSLGVANKRLYELRVQTAAEDAVAQARTAADSAVIAAAEARAKADRAIAEAKAAPAKYQAAAVQAAADSQKAAAEAQAAAETAIANVAAEAKTATDSAIAQANARRLELQPVPSVTP